jgi:hypothetical protein
MGLHRFTARVTLTQRALALATLTLVALGCGSGEEPTSPSASSAPAPPLAPSPPPLTLQAETAATEPAEPPARLVIGVEQLAEALSTGDRAALQRALAVHRSGDYAASEAAFRAFAEAHPAYLMARFNHACALARLGRTGEARALYESLLVLDLPTFGPRLDTDEDLAALREGEHGRALSAWRARAMDAYSRALRDGAAVVHEVVELRDEAVDPSQGADRVTVHAGVWLAAERRFVPMGPRVSSSSHSGIPGLIVLSASVLDRALGVVIAFWGEGADAEGADYITAAHVAAWRAGVGTELASQHAPCVSEGHCSFPELHATDGGVAVRFIDIDGGSFDTPIERTFGQGDARFAPEARPSIECSQAGCVTRLATPEVPVRVERGARATVTWPGGGQSTFDLDRAHAWHRRFRTNAVVRAIADGDGAVYLATAERVSYDWNTGYGASAISRLDRETGRAVLVIGGRAVVALDRGPDGSVYLQVGEHLERRAPGASVGEPLPGGLHLEASSLGGFSRSVYSSF